MSNAALKIYNDFIDLDFIDYTNTIENDVETIEILINKYGSKKAAAIVTDFVENGEPITNYLD